MMRHLRKLHLFASSAALLLFIGFVAVYEYEVRRSAAAQLETHARLLSDALWLQIGLSLTLKFSTNAPEQFNV